MSDIEHNKSVVLAFADTYTRGDWPALKALCTDDFRWVVPIARAMQSNQMRAQERTMSAQNRSLSEMLEVFEMAKSTSVDSRFDLKVLTMTAEADRVAAELEGYAVCAATGRTYNNLYFYLMYFRDGKISLFREYQDTLHAYDVWMAP